LASNDTITVDLLLLHSEVIASVGDKLIVFHEAAGVEEQLNTLARRQFVLTVVLVNARLTATEERLAADILPALDESLVHRISIEVHFFSLDEHLV